MVTLSNGLKRKYPSQFKNVVIPIDDTVDEDALRYFKVAIDYIEAALYPSDDVHPKDKPGNRVLVHCSAGI
jgi:protein-tyrosine phosphatase